MFQFREGVIIINNFVYHDINIVLVALDFSLELRIL